MQRFASARSDGTPPQQGHCEIATLTASRIVKEQYLVRGASSPKGFSHPLSLTRGRSTLPSAPTRAQRIQIGPKYPPVQIRLRTDEAVALQNLCSQPAGNFIVYFII